MTGIERRDVFVADLQLARRRRKLIEILADREHPQHHLAVDLADTAIALDPPSGWQPEQPVLAELPRSIR